jgi:quercetin dioxygenase-like cupin family protein
MDRVLESAKRAFCESGHLKRVLEGEWTTLYNEYGQELNGIRGRAGACSMTFTGYEIGVDLIEMQPGSAFPLHVHAGDHILYILEGDGCVNIDGVDHTVVEGDTIFIPAEYPHGVKTLDRGLLPFRFLAFGHPHKHLDATDRMSLVKE